MAAASMAELVLTDLPGLYATDMKSTSIWDCSTEPGSPERGGEKSQIIEVWLVASKQPSMIFTNTEPPVWCVG
jgi:hypothetical protein